MIDKRLIAELKHFPGTVRLLAFQALTGAATALVLSLCAAQIVDVIFTKKGTAAQVLPLLLLCAAAIALRGIVQYLCECRFRDTGRAIKNRLRRHMAESLFVDPHRVLHEDAGGAGAVLFCEAAEAIEPYYSEFLPQLATVAFTVPLLLLTAFILDPLSGCIMLLTAPLLPVFLALIGRSTVAANRKRMGDLKRLGAGFLDALEGMKTLKLFGRSRAHAAEVGALSEAFRTTTMEILRISFLSALVLELTATISIAMIAVSLGLRLMYGHIPFLPAFTILLLAPEFYLPIRQLGAKFHTAMTAVSGAERLYGRPGPHAEEHLPAPARHELCCTDNRPPRIEISSLTVRYPGSALPALDRISLILEPGSITAVVGRSGCGKSSLAAALLGLVQPESGTILFGGRPIDTITPASLRSHITLVSQDPFLFRGTIAENILFAKPAASRDELRAAMKAAAIDHLAELPEGLDTRIAEDGLSLSRGEAQRLALARAFVRKSPVVICDEVSSALDRAGEIAIQASLKQLACGRTLLMCAHRLETVRHADNIVVLENGHIAEVGSHDELLARGGLYAELSAAWQEEYL